MLRILERTVDDACEDLLAMKRCLSESGWTVCLLVTATWASSAAALGSTGHALDLAARAEWAAATCIMHEQLIEEIGGESRKLYELIQAGLAACAKR